VFGHQTTLYAFRMSPAYAVPPRPERSAHSVSCNQCGAAVPIPRDSELTICSYCNNRVFVEPNLRKHHDRALQAVALETEARHALASALSAESRARARNQIALIAAVVGAPAGIAGAIVHFAGEYLEDWLTRALQVLTLGCTLVAALVGGVVAMVLLSPQRIAEHATTQHERFTRGIRDKPLSSKCPSCGAPCEASAVTRTFRCGHCQVELLVSSGVAIRWSEDARAREQEWRTEAERALTYAEFDFSNRWVMWYALMFIAASGYNALLAVLGVR
jgi:DNA-directed RNA polymerase subunit RPC12/RpoP